MTDDITDFPLAYLITFRCHGYALQTEFAERVEQLGKRKMTQRGMAKELGVGSTTVNRCLKALKQKEPAPNL